MATRESREKLNGMGISDTAIRQPVFITMMMLLAITFGILFGNSQSLTNYYYTFALSQLVYLVYFILLNKL